MILQFDHDHVVSEPELILMTKSGIKRGRLYGFDGTHFVHNLNSADELSFRLHKEVDGERNPLWDDVVDFKVIWYKNVNTCFEISVDTDEADETVKNVSGIALAEAELSQLDLYDVEINTEDDIARDDYVQPTVFYNYDASISLLNRLLYKAPHYEIGHVDSSLCSIQRTFSFDGTSIIDAFNTVGEEVGCLFVYDSGLDQDGKIIRKINAYDLMNRCRDCGKRFEGAVCPKCGGSSYDPGYGSNTGIVIAKENLADNITYSSNKDSVKNCFHLVAGDDEMTAAVRSCNPNGSSYIWRITDEMKADMSDQLVFKIDAYDALYKTYAESQLFEIDSDDYNALVTKYRSLNRGLQRIYSGGTPVTGNDIELKGTTALVEAEYAALDFSSYLQSTMMPTYEYVVPSAVDQCTSIHDGIKTVSVTNLKNASAATVELSIKSLAKLYAHTEIYKVEVTTTSYVKPTWQGTITLINYSDASDTATTEPMTVTVNDSATSYVEELVQKKVKDYGEKKYDITDLFHMSYRDFANALTLYSLDCLEEFDECCQACLAVLVDQGAGAAGAETYDVYADYYNKLQAIESEIVLRNYELSVIGTIENDDGILHELFTLIDGVHQALNFESFIGEDLWKEFIAYRREQEYTNNNYVSDGLNNAEIIENARAFYDTASTELYKSSTLQHSISANLADLLAMKEFEGLVWKFDVGNWIYIIVDEKPYRLRLVSYEIDFGNIQDIDVEFSDVLAIKTGISDLQSVLSAAKTMATSYGAVARQAAKGEDAQKDVASWYRDGIDATKTYILSNANNQDMKFGDSGLLGRRWDDSTGSYSPEQCRLINTTLAFTDDGWKTVRTALGKIVVDGEEKYGLLAENVYGKFGRFVTLDADTVTITGRIQDAAGLNYWDMETGDFHLQAISDLDQSLDSTGVFNRLTNNGTLQGLYMENGNLYVNGTYIKAGTIEADRLNIEDLFSKNITATGSFQVDNGAWKLQQDTTGLNLRTAAKSEGGWNPRVNLMVSEGGCSFIYTEPSNLAAGFMASGTDQSDLRAALYCYTNGVTVTKSAIWVGATNVHLNGDTITSYGNIVPSETNNVTLGTPTKQWNGIYANYIGLNGSSLSDLLSGKAPTSHAVNASTYGLGTTGVYGHVKTVNNVTTSAHASGLALSAYQGKVLKDAIDAINTTSSSRLTLTRGWTVANSNNWCKKRGNVVSFFLGFNKVVWTTGGMVTCATLPSGYRPTNAFVGTYCKAWAANNVFMVRVGTDGAVQVNVDPAISTTDIYVSCTFVI